METKMYVVGSEVDIIRGTFQGLKGMLEGVDDTHIKFRCYDEIIGKELVLRERKEYSRVK
ncbi:hypothetical protein [Bacillus sp. NEAU-Y102]